MNRMKSSSSRQENSQGKDLREQLSNDDDDDYREMTEFNDSQPPSYEEAMKMMK